MNKYKIEPKEIYGRLSGEVKGVATSALIFPLPYTLFNPTVRACIEFYNSEGEVLIKEFNIDIPTPEDWGIDDTVVVEAFAKALKVVIVPEEPIVIPE